MVGKIISGRELEIIEWEGSDITGKTGKCLDTDKLRKRIIIFYEVHDRVTEIR